MKISKASSYLGMKKRKFIKLLNDCEFERYAPIGNKELAMRHTFESTEKLISTLESTIRR